MHLALIVNILPIFKKGGQELKAHLFIKSTNGTTHNFVWLNFVLISPCWEGGTWCRLLPNVCLYCLVLNVMVLVVIPYCYICFKLM